ncbi:MAG: hypothetical protein ACRBN8_22590 [Nannocystales bacterium]
MTAKKTTKKAPAKKTTAPKKSGRAPARQSAIPGTKPKRDPKLEKLAEAYENARDERIGWGVTEKAAKTKLTEYMVGAKLKAYTDGDLEVTLEPKDNTPSVKVKRAKNDKGEE